MHSSHQDILQAEDESSNALKRDLNNVKATKREKEKEKGLQTTPM
jgi:hypothetical protein